MCKKLLAEALGTMVLVLMGCGAAVFNHCGINDTETAAVLITAIAFGLSVVGMAYTIGGISGCHINPAITLGAWLTGRMKAKEAGGYMAAQVVGALVGSTILYILTQGTGFEGEAGANVFREGQMMTAFIAEVVFTFIFVLVVLGTTDEKLGSPKLAGLAIGLTLILVHIVCIRITGTSVNPARSISAALFQDGGTALCNLWLFIVAPFIGAALSAGAWKVLTCEKK